MSRFTLGAYALAVVSTSAGIAGCGHARATATCRASIAAFADTWRQEEALWPGPTSPEVSARMAELADERDPATRGEAYQLALQVGNAARTEVATIAVWQSALSISVDRSSPPVQVGSMWAVTSAAAREHAGRTQLPADRAVWSALETSTQACSPWWSIVENAPEPRTGAGGA